METEKLLAFFEKFWGQDDCVVYTPVKVPGIEKEKAWKQYFHKWPEQSRNVAQFVLSEAAKGHDIYFGPVTYRRPPEGERPGKGFLSNENVMHSRALWVDFDGNAPDSWDKDYPEPSLTVISSGPGNQHNYWLLDEPIADTSVLENYNRTLAYEVQADTSGWDATQVLRPPYTTNYKRQEEPRPVTIDSDTEVKYARDRFKLSEDFRPRVEQYLSLSDIPPVAQILMDHEWPDDFYSLLYEPAPAEKRSDKIMLLAYTAMEQGCTDSEAYSLIVDADSRLKKYADRTDKEKRYADIIERARSKVPYAPLEVATESAPKEAPRILWSFSDFMQADVQIEWLYQDFMAKQTFGLIIAPPGVGKTQLSLRMAFAMCQDMDFLSWKAVLGRPLKVLFLSLEMAHAPLKHFVATMDVDSEIWQKLDDNLTIVPAGVSMPIDQESGKRYINNMLRDTSPDVVIVDSLSKLCSASLSDDDSMRKLLSIIGELKQQYNCAFLVIHHDRKSTDRKPRIIMADDIYGSRFLLADADFAFSLNRLDAEKPDHITVHHAKTRLGPMQKDHMIIRTHDLDFVEAGEMDIDSNSVGDGELGAFEIGGNLNL